MFFCQSYSARVFKMTNIKTGRNNFTINLQTNKIQVLTKETNLQSMTNGHSIGLQY